MFDAAFLVRLEYLALISRRVFQGELLSHHRSDKKSGGVEFADYRDYATGDDLRYLDWNAFARNGSLFIKRFQDEEDLHVYFLLDSSLSMAGEDGSKWERAKELAAALAYIALADGDRVDIRLFDRHLRGHFALTRGKQHILRLLRFLEGQPFGMEGTDLTSACREFLSGNPRTGLVVLISDFYDPRGWQAGLNLLRGAGFEPQMIALYAEDERNPTCRGDVELTDTETGQRHLLTVGEPELTRYRHAIRSFHQEILDWTRHLGLAGIVASSRIPFDELILRMMKEQHE